MLPHRLALCHLLHRRAEGGAFLTLFRPDSMNLNAVCAVVAPRRSDGYSFAGEAAVPSILLPATVPQ